MTKNRWMENPEAVREAQRLYSFIGEYIIIFQWIEAKIDDMYLLGKGRESSKSTFAWLSKKTIAQKIDGIFKLITEEGSFNPVSVDGWNERLRSLIAQLHGERNRRNGILHAQYLFDFLAIGAPVLRTRIHRQSEGASFEQEYLSVDRCQQILEDMAQLSFEVNMVHLQLIHAYKYPDEETSD